MLLTRRARIAVLLALFLISVLVGCKTTMPIPGSPYVEARNQELLDSLVIIKYVVSVGPGWIVIHLDKDGKPGDIVGYSPVTDGVNHNVFVSVNKSKKSGTLWAMLHSDTGKIGTFEFPGGDLPVMEMNSIMMKRFKIMKTIIMPGNSGMSGSY